MLNHGSYFHPRLAFPKHLALSEPVVSFEKLKALGAKRLMADVTKENETTDSIRVLMSGICNAEKQLLNLRNQSQKKLAQKTIFVGEYLFWVLVNADAPDYLPS